MSSLYFTISAFFVAVLIVVVFFSKARIKNKETKLFSYLILANLYTTIIEFIILFLTYKGISHSIISFLNRFYLPAYLLWAWLFLLYISYISFKHRSNFEIIYKRILFITGTLSFLVLIFLFILPIKIFYDGNVMYSYGTAIDLLYTLCVCFLFLVFVFSFMNYKNLKNKKYLPIFILLILAVIIFIVRQIDPSLLLITAVLTYINLIMYYTIENPDIKMMGELELSKMHAEKANQAKSDFLSNMSHEIRTPLNAIVGFSQTLIESNDFEQAKEDAKDILIASESLLEIVSGVLDISKIESGKMDLYNSEYSFKKIFSEVATLVRTKLIEKPIEFKTSFDESVPEVLYGDYAKLKQIMLNLLSNAVKYTKTGYIELKISSVIKENVCRLIISIEDSGIGIDPQKIDKLFTKFERLNDGHITAEGTGLGLAITKSLVDMMNGKIVVQSTLGKGSRFTVSIDQEVTNKNIDELTQKTINISIEDINLYGKKALVVDDNKINLKVATRILKEYGLEIEEVESGLDCINIINSGKKYDIIFLDDMMPVITGVETLKKLKTTPGFSTPVIALTANAVEGMREKYITLGFNDYLAKPIEKTELIRIIKKFLT